MMGTKFDKIVAVKVLHWPNKFMGARSGRWTLKLSDGTKVKFSCSVSTCQKLREQKRTVLWRWNEMKESPKPCCVDVHKKREEEKLLKVPTLQRAKRPDTAHLERISSARKETERRVQSAKF